MAKSMPGSEYATNSENPPAAEIWCPGTALPISSQVSIAPRIQTTAISFRQKRMEPASEVAPENMLSTRADGKMQAAECYPGAMPAEDRRPRILALQRARRGRSRRIDYYASAEAAALIEQLRRPGIGGDASSIINQIIKEWASTRGTRIPEFRQSITREGKVV